MISRKWPWRIARFVRKVFSSKSLMTYSAVFFQHYKLIVKHVEKFAVKCKSDHKIAAVYIIDSICRFGQPPSPSTSTRHGVFLSISPTHFTSIRSMAEYLESKGKQGSDENIFVERFSRVMEPIIRSVTLGVPKHLVCSSSLYLISIERFPTRPTRLIVLYCMDPRI